MTTKLTTTPGKLTGSLLILIICLSFTNVQAQTVEFFDDFESGAAAWVTTGMFGISTTYASSGTNSFSESPTGLYPDAYTAQAEMAVGVDLTTALDAEVNFEAKFDIEAGFDYMYLEVSGDGGGAWNLIDAFDGENNLAVTPFSPYNYSLGGYVGNSDVRIRFRFVSDGFVNYEGMYIDDVEIVSFNTDLAAPLILHSGPEFYEGTTGDFVVSADLIDVSGIASTDLMYRVDGSAATAVAGINVSGDTYEYLIPAQSSGAWVEYDITATDGAVSANSITTDTFKYIAGEYIYYDNSVVDFVNDVGPLSASTDLGAAVRISLAGPSDLVTVLIRNYTDPGRPNDDILVHVWSDAGGLPGTDLITPVLVTPEATLSDPQPMTRVDLRPFTASLSGLTGDIYVGYTVPSGVAWLTQTTPGMANRTYNNSGLGWLLITDDYHFRAITSPPLGAPSAAFSVDDVADPTIAFTDMSAGTPTSWDWTFGDGGTSTDQHPSYTYTANNTYNVCLTATNAVGTDTHCQDVTVDGIAVLPVAAFEIDSTNDPLIHFTDLSVNTPTSWEWDFGDGSNSSGQHPDHDYAVNGVYTVCLTSTNAAGSSTPVCEDLKVDGVPSGLEDIAMVFGMQLFPSPATDVVELRWTGSLPVDAKIDLISTGGQLLNSLTPSAGADHLRIQIGHLPAGMYMLSIETESFGRSVLPFEHIR